MNFIFNHPHKYQNIFLLFFFTLVLCNFSISAPVDDNPENGKNGEIYILTTDSSTRGVYRLNNLDNQNTLDEDEWTQATFLYDPLECRGIKVSNSRQIYTFGHDKSKKLTDGIRHDVQIEWKSRKIKVWDWWPFKSHYKSVVGRRNSYYGDHSYHHDYHSRDDDYPSCSDNNCLPYADLDGSKKLQIAIRGTTFGETGWYSIKNMLWYHSLDLNSKKNGKLCYQDIVTRINHDYNLYQWDEAIQGIGNSAIIKAANVASSFEETKIRHILNGCHDSCGVNNDNVDLEAVKYITDVSISVTGTTPHTYFYIRADKTGATGKILKDGTAIKSSEETIIGNPNDSTTKFIGTSSKSSNKDYIYILGNNEIKKWLSPFGSTSGLNIDKISVSNMWWQTGGMVFALDSENKKVYKFERNEISDSVVAPMIMSIPSGVTDITSDGFGNLYYVNSIKYPDGSPPTFTGRDVQYSTLKWTQEGTNKYVAEVTYLQGVEKTVWKKNYYNGTITKVGKVRVGNIPWRSRVQFDGSNPPVDKNNWLMGTSSITNLIEPQLKGTFDTGADVEISAINQASPPQVVGFKEGHVDICGPYEYNESDTAVLASTPYEENKIYQFRVENFPWFDDYGVNTNSDLSSGDDDQNDNNFTGGFVSSIVKQIPKGWPNAGLPGITYTWKVKQITDRYGKKVDKDIFESIGTSNPIFNFLYEGGDYQVSVSATFHWYDYDKMPAGSLISERPIVASYNTKAADVKGGNIAGNSAPNGTKALAPVDIAGFSPSGISDVKFGGDGEFAWAKISIQKVDSLNIPGGVGEIVMNPTYRSPDLFYPNAGTNGSSDSIKQKWDSRSIIAPDPNNSVDPKFKWAKKGNEKNSSEIPVFTINQGDTALITIKENQKNLPTSQYTLNPSSTETNKSPIYIDRLKQMFLDDSLGTYEFPDPKYDFETSSYTTQKIYCGNLLNNPEFKYIVYNDPLVIAYTKIGENKLPTIRWKDAWDEVTGLPIPNAGPTVKWNWELLDSAGNAIIQGQKSSTLTPELNPQNTDGSNIWEVPSAPGLYKLTVKINRIYVYNTFEEICTKYNPSTGRIDDKITKAVEHAHNILIAGECYVYVRDTAAPTLISGVDGSGSLPHFYGFAGNKINTVTSNPLSNMSLRNFEVFVEDNNPFDSGFRTPQITAADSIIWLNDTYKPVEFDTTKNQAGMISHETAVFKLNANDLPDISKVTVASPNGSDNELYYASTIDKAQTDAWKKSYGSQSGNGSVINDGGVAQFKQTDTTLKPFNEPDTVSTTKYTVDITNLDRFSKPFDSNKNGEIDNNIPDIQDDCLPYFHASNSTDDSDDYKFFFFARDSSGNISASFEVAELEVLDKNKPNIFVKATDPVKAEISGLKATISAPSHVLETYMKHFFVEPIPTNATEKSNMVFSGFTTIDENDWIYAPGSDTITNSNNSILFPNAILEAPDAGGATKFTNLSFPDIVEDSRIKFEVFAIDNVPRHFGGADSPFGEVDTTSDDPDIMMYVVKDLCTVDQVIDGTYQPFQTINFKAPQTSGATVNTIETVNFREPGEYYLVGYVRDRAPLTSRDGNVVNPTPNRRDFRFRLEIMDTAINVHTLESE